MRNDSRQGLSCAGFELVLSEETRAYDFAARLPRKLEKAGSVHLSHFPVRLPGNGAHDMQCLAVPRTATPSARDPRGTVTLLLKLHVRYRRRRGFALT